VRRNHMSAGFTLVELMIASALIGLVIIGIAGSLRLIYNLEQTTELQLSRGSATKTIFTKLKAIDFYRLYTCDSRLPAYGLPGTVYGGTDGIEKPYQHMAALAEIEAVAHDAGFDDFALSVAILRRDTSDINGDGSNSDLVEYTDTSPVDLQDDYDKNVRYYDRNGDGDFNDLWLVDGQVRSEMPDTHIKSVTLFLYTCGEESEKQTRLLNLEQLRGGENPSQESALPLALRIPLTYNAQNNPVVFYSESHSEFPACRDARRVPIINTYPQVVTDHQVELDSNHPLRVEGETCDGATVSFNLNGAPNSVFELHDAFINTDGTFDLHSYEIARQMAAEASPAGWQKLEARAKKNTYESAWVVVNMMYDVSPPVCTQVYPDVRTWGYSIKNRTPRVGITFKEQGSGLCDSVSGFYIKDRRRWIPVTYYQRRNEADGTYELWLSGQSDRYVPVVLDNMTVYRYWVEVGDRAGYKLVKRFIFSVRLHQSRDRTPPEIINITPTGIVHNAYEPIAAKLVDDQTGIDARSVLMTLNGVEVVNADSMGCYQEHLRTVTYQPTTPLANHTIHRVRITCKNWADPQQETTKSWQFTTDY